MGVGGRGGGVGGEEGGGEGGEEIKHERGSREQYLSRVTAKTGIEVFLLFSTAVQGSRQTVWFNVFVPSTIILFISMRGTYFRIQIK